MNKTESRHADRRRDGESRCVRDGAGLDPRFDLTKAYWVIAESAAAIRGRIARLGGVGESCDRWNWI